MKHNVKLNIKKDMHKKNTTCPLQLYYNTNPSIVKKKSKIKGGQNLLTTFTSALTLPHTEYISIMCTLFSCQFYYKLYRQEC